MSITFWDPVAEVRRRPYACLCSSFAGESSTDPRCPECRGAGVVTFEYHEGAVTLANDNARALLSMLGESPADAGRWGFERLPDIQRAITRALNVERVRAGHRREGAWSGRMYVFRRDDEYLREKLCALQVLVSQAQTRGSLVCWG